jgi:transcriptional regulator with XRE-family HTH domain/tetratricopeptide (TPR) repeat protein
VPDAAVALGEQIAYHRKRLGLSQVRFAARVGRSESWVSQIERGVRSIDRMSVLQSVADALSVSTAELNGEDMDAAGTPEGERPEAVDTVRMSLTGHPALRVVISGTAPKLSGRELDRLRDRHAAIWPLVHGSVYSELAPILASLIPELEAAARSQPEGELTSQASELLADTYQATAAMLAKVGETDAAWIAADRAAFTSEATGSPLAVAASMFRMAHVFLSLGQIAQAQEAAESSLGALAAYPGQERSREALSLTGAFHLVLAIAAARDNDRQAASSHLAAASAAAGQVGEGQNDYGTEFGPVNVALHAVSVAVELGDAGQALDLAREIDTSGMSPERQARYLIDLAAAHAMRRQIGESLASLQQAEQLTPEQTRGHRVARAVARDLIQLSGPRPRPELRELADRFGLSA